MAIRNGKRIKLARRISTAVVFVLVVLSLAFDTGFGTPSAIGVGEFFLLCPLGGLEAMLASKTFLPITAISLAIVLLFAAIFGRVWCAWGCPVPSIRTLIRGRKQSIDIEKELAQKGRCSSGCSAKEAIAAQLDAGMEKKLSERLFALVREDRRMLVLVGVLIVTFAAGFPIFCLVCPIGLTFGTVIALWHLFVYKQVTASVLVFPLCLIIELIIYRKWCTNLCPIAALLSLFGRLARRFRPVVDTDACLLYTSENNCHACTKACAEAINLHVPSAAEDIRDCTRCGECLAACPTNAIRIGAEKTSTVLLAEEGDPDPERLS